MRRMVSNWRACLKSNLLHAHSINRQLSFDDICGHNAGALEAAGKQSKSVHLVHEILDCRPRAEPHSKDCKVHQHDSIEQHCRRPAPDEPACKFGETASPLCLHTEWIYLDSVIVVTCMHIDVIMLHNKAASHKRAYSINSQILPFVFCQIPLAQI